MSSTDKEARLPFPADGKCECGSFEYTVVETGYVRFTTARVNSDNVLWAYTDGWDDMSEGGDDEWLQCEGENCDRIYVVPETIEYS